MLTDIDPHEIEQQYHLSSHAPKNLLTKYRHIHSFVIIGYAFAYTIFCRRDKKREPTVTAYSLKINKEVYSKYENFVFYLIRFALISFDLLRYHCSFLISCSMELSGLVPILILYLKAVISHHNAAASGPHILIIISMTSISY